MNNLRSLLNIDFLVRENAVKNWRMILFLSFLAVIMISSGHSADKKIFKIASLNTEIKALKSDFIEGKKELLRLKKEWKKLHHNTLKHQSKKYILKTN